MKSYIEVKIPVTTELTDEVYNKLYILGFDTILEEENYLIVYVEDTRSEEIDNLKSGLDGLINPDSIQIKKFEDRNWNREWETNIEPVYIREKIAIFPSWQKENVKDVEIKIEIDPKMSFGTGHNETTQLVLELMCDFIDKDDKYMLDFGSGTGVLTIAGIKMGMEKAIAIDTDNDAIENSIEYFRINGVSENVYLHRKNIKDISEEKFDVICANIIRSVIENNIRYIYEKLKPGGKIFISGVLVSETERVFEVLSASGFSVKEVYKKAEWLGIYARKE